MAVPIRVHSVRALPQAPADDCDVDDFPSLKASRLLAILARQPLGYRVVRQSGSHRTLAAPGRPRVVFAWHDKHTIPPGLVRKVLVRDVGLDEREARRLL